MSNVVRHARTPLPALLAVLMTILVAAPAADAVPPGMPPSGKVLLGVADDPYSVSSFNSLTRAQHKIRLRSYNWVTLRDWNKTLGPVLQGAVKGDYRLMLHLTPRNNEGREVFSPREVAYGAGDGYLIRLSSVLNRSGQAIYVRPPGEMNGHWSMWCAFNENGTRKDAAHATSEYRRAFQRMTVIMRGGEVSRINGMLRNRGMRTLRTNRTSLPASGRIAMVFNPQGRGAPDVAGNQPQDYYPGRYAVDYVANDMYAQNNNAAWADNDALYRRYSGDHPYMMAEYAPWGYDDPTFMRRMFTWVAEHPRTVALIYFQGITTSPFRLEKGKAKSLSVYRGRADAARFSCPGLGPIERAC